MLRHPGKEGARCAMWTLLLLSLLVGSLAAWEYYPHPVLSRRRLPMRACGSSRMAGPIGRAHGSSRTRCTVSRSMVEEAISAYVQVYDMGRSEATRRAYNVESWIFRQNRAIGFYL